MDNNNGFRERTAKFQGFTSAKLEDIERQMSVMDKKIDLINKKIEDLDKFDKKLALKVGGIGSLVGALVTIGIKVLFGV